VVQLTKDYWRYNVYCPKYTPTSFTVTFPEPFAQPPHITLSVKDSVVPTVYIDAKAKTYNITASQFTAYAIGETNVDQWVSVHWTAIGEA
jgi:hypothetical protein